ncbi:hypothetical protein [Maribacter sp. HTCC2170]|uniref:hypothetical protein n=1 Tax=Maribacter sp. (strain HTCC2170 / KCCM 42371) TaxID=313603 RepID=UPI00006BD3D3|nr:hypothetical protein [Maribacter sp. HTCC2170]EAR02985.1 hypothetical protein FB2170_06840 [Maribacter sp. HTCC2170]
MIKLRDTPYYNRAIHEINYSFGDFYLFDTFVVGEIHEDILFSWNEHGKQLFEVLFDLYDNNGKDIVYISNRVNDYSVIPTDWKKFHKFGFMLKAYGIISYTQTGLFNAMLERMFVNTKLRWFNSLEDAIQWVGKLSNSNVLTPLEYKSTIFHSE